jgi:hypothetical protein
MPKETYFQAYPFDKQVRRNWRGGCVEEREEPVIVEVVVILS